MSDSQRTNEIICPFAELLDRHVLGDSSQEDDARLQEHVDQGCPSCAPRYHDESHLDDLVRDAMQPIEEEVESRRYDMLAKISEQIAKEEKLRAGRQTRRRGLNTILFVTLVAGFSLLAFAYVMTARAAMKVVNAQCYQAKSEIGAVLVALRRYCQEHGQRPLETVPLGTQLMERRLDLQTYYEPRVEKKDDQGRVIEVHGGAPMDKEGHLLDPWGRRYIYERTKDGARIRSLGPTGRDESTQTYHLVGDVLFEKPPKREPPKKEVGAAPPRFDPTNTEQLKLVFAAFKALNADNTDKDAVAALQTNGVYDDEGNLNVEAHAAWLPAMLDYRAAHRDEWDRFLAENDKKWHDYITPAHDPK